MQILKTGDGDKPDYSPKNIGWPYLGYIEEVNSCVKKLLVCFNGGCLWLEINISVDVNIIASIIGITLARFNPTPFFAGKYHDTRLKKK